MQFKFQGSPLVADVSAGLIMSNQSLVLQRVREDYGDNDDDDGDGDGDHHLQDIKNQKLEIQIKAS